jgi:uncharacterized protein YjiS (DUF1127 family)
VTTALSFDQPMKKRQATALPRGDNMLKTLTFRSDGAFWPLAERSDSQPTRASGGLVAMVAGLVRRLQAERAARRATAQLESFDDRTLRDLGISRDQVWHAVRYGREAVQGEAFDIARWS